MRRHTTLRLEMLRSASWLEPWIHENIHRPIKGFESKRNIDGTLYNYAQQINATRLQVLSVALYFLQRGKEVGEVTRVISHFK